ncbi:MAG: hypothetical protein JKY97_00950 [Citromicrobium sp.]|nr:hypothetical protein [Citromicrobium sp.]
MTFAMIDYVQCEIPARLPAPITGDIVLRHTTEGELVWQTHTRRKLVGSYDASLHVRAIDPFRLEISGNPAKFLQGHNLWGPFSVRELLERSLQRIQPILWPEGMPTLFLGEAEFARLDVTASLAVGSAADAKLFLRAHHERGNRPYVGRGCFKGTDESTLVYGDATGKRAKAWQIGLYLKGVEVTKDGHRLPQPMLEDGRLIEWINRVIRVECRFRRSELQRIAHRRGKPMELDNSSSSKTGRKLPQMTLNDWEPIDPSELWREYYGKIDMIGEIVEPDHLGCGGMGEPKPRHIAAFYSWKAGLDLREHYKKSQWYALRSECREFFEIDIAMPPPKLNVVPLRRIIDAQPAHRPPWADDVDRRLSARAA